MTAKHLMGLKQVFQNMANLLAPFTVQRTMTDNVTYRAPANVPTLPTGFPALDKALEIGGLPYGKIAELVGSGQATMSDGTACIAARIAAKVQRQQRLVTILDLTRSFDVWQAERCGLAAPQLLVTRPDTLFDALTNLEQAAQNTDLIIIIMGVVSDLLGDVEPDLLTTLLRRLHSISRRAESAFLCLTTPRETDPFSPTNYPHGFPLADLASVRLWVQEESWTHKDAFNSAYKANLTVIKNDLGVAGKAANIRVKLSHFQTTG